MKKEQTKNNFIKDIIIIIIVGIIVNAFCFFVGSIHSEAATQVNVPWPYIVDEQNAAYNTSIVPYLDGIVESVKDKFDYSSDTDDPFFIVIKDVWWKDTDTSDPYWAAECFVYWNVTFDDTLGSNFTDKSFNFVANSGNVHRFDIWLDSFRIYSYDNRNNGDFYCLGQPQTSNLSIGTFTPDYIIYCSQDVYDGNTLVVSQSGNDNVVDFVESPLITNFDSPVLPSVPTVETPTIDTSLSVIENVKILFSWLGNTIKSFFQWIINVIVALFTSLFTNLKNFINAIITGINNGFSTIIANFKALFSLFFNSITNFIGLLKQSQEDFFTFCKNRLTDISSVLNGLSQGIAKIAGFYDYPLYLIDKYGFFYNQEMVTSLINNSDFISSVAAFKTQASTLVNNFSSVSEPDHLSFTLDFTNAYYNFGVCEFSFDWILPFRNPIRLFVVGVTVLSMLTNFMEDFPSMFSGGGGHSKNTGK